MGRVQGRSWAWAAAAAVACSPLPEDPQSPSKRENSAPKKAPQSQKSARRPCEGAPVPLGRSAQRPSLKFPGPVHALEWVGASLWVCGQTQRDQGFLSEVVKVRQGHYRVQRSRSLDAPCRGLSPAEGGLAVWLRGWKALWYPSDRLKEDFDSPQRLTLRAVSPGDFDPGWPIRAQWIPQEQAFYLAAGARGLLRLEKNQEQLSFDRAFSSPKLFARDLARLGSALVVADPHDGLIAWSPSERRELGRWQDARRKGPAWMQRVQVQGQRLAVAAGPAGSYLLRAEVQSGRLSVQVEQRESSNEPRHHSTWSDEGPWWASSSRLWDARGRSQRRLTGIHGQAAITAIVAERSGGLWVAQGNRVEHFDSLHPDAQIAILPQSSFGAVHEGASGEFPFVVRGEGSLWVQAPKLRGGEGLSLELENWPEPVEGCPELYRFTKEARVTVRVRAEEDGQAPSLAQLRLRSSDPELGELRLDIVRDSPKSPQRLDSLLPTLAMARWTDGIPGPPVRSEQWQWLEFVGVESLGTPANTQRIDRLRALVRDQARNGAFRLRASMIVGGRGDRIEPSFLDRLAAGTGILDGFDLYFDERYDGHRVVSRTNNGRFYPLRILVDPQGKIRYIDQKPGLASAIGHYLELSKVR